ncbi:MAG: hypothetical protein M1839_000658 [Geoglossum umbratile]|nr:MAG: hypothetical protein M1839_000658 [Geoglossum umbratile]
MATKLERPNISNLFQHIKLRMRASAHGKQFIETRKLYEIFTEKAIEPAVEELGCKDFERAGLAKEIGQNYRKVFAILIWIGCEDEVVNFRCRRFTDSWLPLDESVAQEVFAAGTAASFMSSQWTFLPHFFSTTSGSYCHQNITPIYIILPVVDEVRREKRGEFGEISTVVLPTSSQSLLSSQIDTITLIKKTIKRPKSRTNERHQQIFEDEMRMLSLLRSLDHPNIIRLLASYTFQNEHNLLFPHLEMDLGQFFNLNHRFGEFRWNSTFHLALYGLASALETIHEFRLDLVKHDLDLFAIGYHHDFRPANVLVSDTTFVLSDFGLGGLNKPDAEDEKEWFPTPNNYSAPECENQDFESQLVSPKIDVWAFGCLVSDVLTYMRKGRDGVQQFRKLRREKVPGKDNWESCRFHFSQEKLKSSVVQWLRSLESEDHQLQGAVAVALGTLKPDRDMRMSISSARSRLAVPTLWALAQQLLDELQKLLGAKFTKQRLSMKLWWAHMQIYLFSKAVSPKVDRESHFARNAQSFDQFSCILTALLRKIETNVSGMDREGTFENDFERMTQELTSGLPNDVRNAAEAQWFLSMSSNTEYLALLNSKYSESHQGRDETSECIRKQLRDILMEIKNGRDTEAPEVYHNHQDLKYVELYGEHEYGIFRGQKVLVESMYFKTEIGAVSPSERCRVMQLKAKGFQLEPKPHDLRILKCLGFVDEVQRLDGSNGYSFIYELPQEAVRPRRFQGMVTLFEVMDRTAKSTAEQPCVREKYQLASALASFFRELHDINYLHENLNTRNIVFAKDPSIAGDEPNDDNPDNQVSLWSQPYVIGLQKSRPDGQKWATEGPASNQKWQKDEQHPSYHDQQRFFMEYDYYSLGLVLFQIGVWSPLQAMSEKPAQFRKQPGHKYFKKLRTYTDPEYREATRVCLDGTLERRPDQDCSIDEQNREVLQMFIQRVLLPLRRLSG